MENKLVEGLTYTGQVIGIRESVDSFTKKVNNKISYCHRIEIVVTGMGSFPFTTQLCTESGTMDLFEANDHIKFLAHAFNAAKNEWTIRFIEKMMKPKHPQQMIGGAPAEEIELPQPKKNRNPIVAGTAIDRAYYIAATHLQMRGDVKHGDLKKLANEIYDDMLTKID